VLLLINLKHIDYIFFQTHEDREIALSYVNVITSILVVLVNTRDVCIDMKHSKLSAKAALKTGKKKDKKKR
jgi:hypothetical protein